MSKIYVFNTSISLVSATRLAGAERIKEILGLQRIPAAMKPLLRQSVIPRDLLNPLEMHKKRVRDFLLRHATRDGFFGWIINPERKDGIIVRVRQIQGEFERDKQALLARYDHACRVHLEALREVCLEEGVVDCEAFIEALRAAQPSHAYLEARLQFSYLRPRLIELEPDEVEIVREGLYAQALHEIATRAKGAQGFKHTTAMLRVAEEIESKLEGLAYIEPRLRRVAEEIRQIVAEIPRGLRNEDYGRTHVLALSTMFAVLADEIGLASAVERSGGLFPVLGAELDISGMGDFGIDSPEGDEDVEPAPSVPAPEMQPPPAPAFYGW